MKVIADLHIHSKYSRACSQILDLPHLDYWAKLKGIQVMGTGDFTHPAWFKQISESLVASSSASGSGLYRLREEFKMDESKRLKNETLFLLTSEISCIYSRGGKVRRVHVLIFAPSVEVVRQINEALDRIGNLKADGRPILGLDAQELARLVFNIDPSCMVVPAHAWTPWFAVFGSKSGFDSLEECFGDLTPQIYAIETGLSSDPSMNRRLSQLDGITLISNSDAHSLPNLGREANVFDLDRVDYASLTDAIKSRRGF
ncbi:DNA helicase UvrD, partial [Candidatus Uhrbacteria bacterium]|nr:DNA helicase UvrD [Candidatus Uhrbacteria bacterium]